LLLIAGGQLDLNLQALTEAASRLAVPSVDLRIQAGVSPLFHWDLNSPWSGALPWGEGALPRAAFIRQDVFAALSDPRPEVAQRALGWFTAVQGWLLAHPGIRTFNTDISAVAFNKPAALLRARAAGLRIPATWVSNDTALLRQRLSEPSIAKPVAGGGLCQTLAEALQGVSANFSAMPALIQPQLVAPELRVFVIGTDAFAFEVRSPSLDYRALQDAELAAVPVPSEATALRALMRELRMDFGAADFKTDPHTGELVFLELNTSPMFARFDSASEGRLTESMVRQLIA
jgi:glutathione synthase/RimK-type ligase-like ATP-grasp enzyme